MTTPSSRRDMWPRKERVVEKERTQRDPPTSAVRCAQISGYEPPLQIEKYERNGRRDKLAIALPGYLVRRFPYNPPIHARGMGALLVLSVRHHSPHQDSSRKRTNRLSHLGLASNTRTPPGLFPSHASARAATSFGLVQCRRMCDRLILTGRRQNQQWSSGSS